MEMIEVNPKRESRLSVPKENDSGTSVSNMPEQSFTTLMKLAGISASDNRNNQHASHFDTIITNFVSKQVRRMCNARITQGETELSIKELVPESTDAFAAVVMVDVSGYSKLTAALAERGPVGAELLSKTMKGYLDQIIEVIVARGDAVIVYWKSNDAVDLEDREQDIERGELVYKASHCCLELLTKLGTYDIMIPDCATKTLKIHLGIGAGLVADIVVGGFPGRWEHFIAGEGVNQLSQVLDLAKAGIILNLHSGELALSHQALKWLVHVVDIRTLNLGDYDKRCIILTGLAKAERRVAAPVEKNETFEFSNPRVMEENMTMYKVFMDRTALFKLKADVNQSKIFRLEAGLMELLDLTESRQITTIFIKIASLMSVSRDDLLQQSQDALQVVQNALAKYDGSLRQFHVDDKGAVILCFFGLPPLAHENDSKLGVHAGIEIREKFLDMFETFAMGITTGVVAFGGVGAEGRAEYAVMGDAVNMAARLMCHKDASRGILCDEKTFNLCDTEFSFESLGETTVKGKSSPIAIFRPGFSSSNSDSNGNSKNFNANSAVIGREEEKKIIRSILEQLKEGDDADIVLFEAQGGQGATTIANFITGEGSKYSCHFCTGKCVQTEQNNAFFVFRSLVYDMINLLTRGSRNTKGEFKVPDPAKPGARNKKGDGEGLVVTPKPVDRKNSTRKTSMLVTTLGENNTLGVGTPMMQNNSMDTEEYEKISFKVKLVTEKLDCTESQAALLQLVTEVQDDELDNLAQASLRLHARDLKDILVKMINMITEHNRVCWIVTETHFMDLFSWDLFLEIAMACPRLGIFFFSRLESTFERKESQRIFRLISQLERSRSQVIEGLSENETKALILANWTTHAISDVDPIIRDSIYKRTHGNPFFIKSLVLALNESGQCRISPNGTLTTPDPNFDFDKLMLGYDNQSIVLAQFDKLDRDFQLLLKIASVLGHKFGLDDVLYFLTGATVESMDRKKYSKMATGIIKTDKYGFLQREKAGSSEGYWLQFKSGVVRQCIYNFMVVQQRQQLHLLIAQYFETKMNEQNHHRYLVQVLDHYSNASEAHIIKQIQYSEMVAYYFGEREAYGQAVQYFKQLIELSSTGREDLEIADLQRANWHRELGHAHFMREEFAEAESNLITSLKLMGQKMDPKQWQMSAQLSKRKKMDKVFFKDRPVPQEEDYTQSYVARQGASGYSLSNIVGGNKKLDESFQMEERDAFKESVIDHHNQASGNGGKTIALSPAQQIIRETRESLLCATQHALTTLADVYYARGNFAGMRHAVILGLNLSTEESIESHMSHLFSLGALCLRLSEEKSSRLAAQYMDAAIGFDSRIDIRVSLQLVTNGAALLFLGGQLEASQNKLQVVSYLSNMAGDLNSRIFGLNLNCIIQTLSQTRETALTTSKSLYSLSHNREAIVGKMWACFHIINNCLGEPECESEILSRKKELSTLWSQFEEKDNVANAPLRLAITTIELLYPFFTKLEPNFKKAIAGIPELLLSIMPHQWLSYVGLVPLALALLCACEKGLVADPETIKTVGLVCDRANKALKGMIGVALGDPLRRVFKGIKIIGKKKAAMKAWQKGIDEGSEDVMTQCMLHLSIANTGEDDKYNSASLGEDILKDQHTKKRFQVIFPIP